MAAQLRDDNEVWTDDGDNARELGKVHELDGLWYVFVRLQGGPRVLSTNQRGDAKTYGSREDAAASLQ